MLFRILISILSIQVSFAQICDTVIKNKIYTSYISYELKMPVQVNYKLYKGGGDCNRSKFRFKNDTKIKLLNDKSYKSSGYDKGHLVNAEDFAFDCKLDELTFRYYNCLPQSPNMNRGIWKVWENQIRLESQTDSLLIMCGGIWQDKVKINDFLVPTYCWKVVYSLSEKKVKHVLLFSNIQKQPECKEKDLVCKQKVSECKEIELFELEEMLNHKLFK